MLHAAPRWILRQRLDALNLFWRLDPLLSRVEVGTDQREGNGVAL